MACNWSSEMQEPSVDTDKLSYEIFSILESRFLFGYEEDTNTNNNNHLHNDSNISNKLSWVPKQVTPAPENLSPSLTPPRDGGLGSLKNQRGKICILSIDGGGMRNIISGKVLGYLENALQVKSGNPDAKIADFIDVAAGAGVAGIFTAMLFGTKDHTRPLFKADDTWRFLADQGSRIYRSGNRPGSGIFTKFFRGTGTRSSTVVLEKLMKEKFVKNGRSLTLKDTLKPVLIPCYDLSSTAPFLFSRADALETDGFDFRLWEVCRATSAEPGVFDPVCMRSVNGSTRCVAVDGGLAMANPTAAAITHVLHNKQEFPFVRGVEDIMVLSIGSGQLLEGSFDDGVVKAWKPKHWARIAADGYADMVDHAVAKAFVHHGAGNYIRVQANGSSSCRRGVNVDTDASPNNVKMLVGIGDEMLKQKNVESILFGGKRISEQSNSEKLDWFAEELVKEHQRRSYRIAPTVAFKQVTDRGS
ncbi:patatin-like protein 6 [Silene latifolia]|uniref:patatin-like protein 6 n=1 Tax=Silene latifolia TaxID=37657 RepID=UPI003D76E9B8